MALFPNRVPKNRMAAHEQEAEAVAVKAAKKAIEAERTNVATRKRPLLPAGAEVIKLEEDSAEEGASSSSAAAGSSKRGRRKCRDAAVYK